MKITHFHKSRVAGERWWPKQGFDDDPRTLLPPLPLGLYHFQKFGTSYRGMTHFKLEVMILCQGVLTANRI